MKKIIFLLLLIVIPIVSGLYVRFDDLSIWHKYQKYFYYENRPLFTSYDAFFFARWGKEYLEGKFQTKERDPLRFVPDNYITENVTYPSPIPMESWLGANLARIKNTHIENVALWLTPILSVLFVIPLILYFWKIDLPIAGFSGALLGSISLMYLLRTSIVRFDTDSLNLFFPFAIAFFLFNSFFSKGRIKYLNLIIAGLLCQGYCWWYAHPGLMLVIIGTYAAGLLFFDKESFIKEKLIYILIILIFSNPVFVFHGIFNLLGLVKTYLINYFKPAVGAGFPNVLMSISEAKHFELIQIAHISAGNILVFILGFAGVVLLFIKRFKETFLLIPIFLIGIMALKGGNRFAMYLSPFIGMGIGYFLDELITYISFKRKLNTFYHYAISLIVIFLVVTVFLFSNKESFSFVAKPKITPSLEENFIKLQDLTPLNSWIWTWWDYGTAIQYLAARAVFHDGQSQGSPKTYFVATSFSSPDPQIARNIILGISNIGAEGIKELSENGKTPEEIKKLIFSGAFSKPVNNPIYWAFTEDLIGKFAWINFFGTWDFQTKRGKKAPIVPLVCKKSSAEKLNCGNIIINLKEGKIEQQQKAFPLRKIIIKDGPKIIERDYHHQGFYFEIVNKNKVSHFFLMEEQPYKSMFNQMFILRNYDKRYFELVYDNFPTMVLFKVK